MSSGRNSPPWHRLNVRLALWHSVMVFLIVCSVLLLNYLALRTRAEELDRDAVLFRLNQYASEYSRGGVPAVIDLAALRKGRAQKAFFVRLASPENRTLFERDAEDWSEFSTQELEKIPFEKGGQTQWITLASDEGSKLLIGSLRSRDGVVVQVGKSTEETFVLLRQFRLVTIVMVALAIPVSFAGGAFLAARALRPLRQLTRTVRGIQETGQFSMRTPESGVGDELDELARIFNAAMARIERLLKTMGESLDNVAHDLRTPMTRLRHRAQDCLEKFDDPTNLREALVGCVEESDGVLETLDTLMDIAEAEAGLTRIPASAVNVTTLVEKALDLYGEVAEDRGVAVDTDIPERLWMKGDAVLLNRVIANLLDNALKYTQRGGAVRIEASREEGCVRLNVIDNGPGISKEDLPQVWERLFRGDKSRTERGLGLGLSFVKVIVEAHGGQVTVSSEPGHGAKFSVQIPAADSPAE